jgi:transposase
MYLFGLDWSEKQHWVCIMTEAGKILSLFSIDHSLPGFNRIEEERQKLGVAAEECLVALETNYHLLLDFLWTRHYTIYVIPPKAVNRYRDRYRQSGASTDASDAVTLAHILRTDRDHHRPWQPDHLLTRQIQTKVALIEDLRRNIQRLGNQLRALLLRYHPQTLELFSNLTIPIALQFVLAYPTPQHCKHLTPEQWRVFCRKHRYPRPSHIPQLYARLQTAVPQPTSETIQACQEDAQTLARLTLQMVQARRQALKCLTALFASHPDSFIFASLPGAGQLLAPALLAKFGDRPERFSSANEVQALAGTCPVTKQSGKKRVVRFRRDCDKDFRRIAQQLAVASVSQSAWAAAYYQQVRPHCDSDSHAYRCLANRWLAIIWKMWQSRQPYDEAYHLRQRAQRRQPRS